jgi:hypothetical protein
MDQNTQIIHDAVQNKTPIALSYGGQFRYLCPHMLGYTAKGLVVHAYQFGGDTSKGPIVDPSDGEWRYLYLNKIEGEIFVAFKGGEWYPVQDLSKSEDTYKPPAFVLKVLALPL